jgi:hypothetical protein
MSKAPVLLTHNGITDSISGWSRRTGIGNTTLSLRLKVGWPLAECLERKPTTPRKPAVRARKKGKLIRGPRCWYNV